MAGNETVLKIKAQIEGLQGLNQLKTALRKSASEAKGADNDFKKLVGKIRELQSSTVKSVNNLNAQKDAFNALKRSVDLNSKEFKDCRDEIEKIDKALKESQGTVVSYSKNSINALRAQKKEFLAVRDSADLMSKEFKEAGVEIAKLDKKLSKAEGRRSGGGRLRAGAQIAGTVAGAAVFGGPEGAIGALLGSAGGVGGAVLGGALGAQVGQLRKAAGGVAEYVAELNLAKGALGGVSKDIVEYNQNLDFAREISNKYAIRLTDVVKGLTGVTAAAKANNLTVKQTQAIYEGITVSGVAAGKSQEDLQALFLATTQVLSKGKASAEEISGQIGERIPGAVAKFAAANKISLQELADQFKAGEVTIAKFVRFTEQQGEDYAEVAESLASGPEKAGIRLQIALDEAGEAFGGFFLNTGAGFQDYIKNLVDFVTENEEQFKILLAKIIVFSEDVYKTFAGLGKAIWQIFGGLFKGIGKLIIEFSRATSAMFKQQDLESLVREKGLKPNDIRRQAFNQMQQESGDLLAPYKDRGALNDLYNKLLAEAAGVDKTDEENRLAEVLKKFGGKYVPPAFAKPGQSAPPTLDEGGDGEDSGTKKTKSKGPRRADFSDLESLFARDAQEKVQKATIELREKITNARREGNKELATALKQQISQIKNITIVDSLERQIRLRALKIAEEKAKGLDVSRAERKQLDDQAKVLSFKQEVITRTGELEQDNLEVQQKATAELEKQRKSFEDQFLDRQRSLGLISSDDYNKVLLGRERERLADPQLGLTSEQQARGLDQYRQTIDPTLTEGLIQNIAELKKGLADLVNPVNQITSAANAIGTAFSKSFTDAITGATTAKEALASFFQSVGSYFLDMAAQMIAEMIKIAILNSVLKLFPSSKGGSGFNLGGFGNLSSSGVGFLEGANIPLLPRANGGPLSANQPSIIGERGPELFIPFQSGRVVSNEMSRASSSQVPFTRNVERVTQAQETAAAMQNAGPIDVRYESQVINNVEYVTAEEYRQGMTQAAERGKALTLSALQNRPAIRSQVGIR